MRRARVGFLFAVLGSVAVSTAIHAQTACVDVSCGATPTGAAELVWGLGGGGPGCVGLVEPHRAPSAGDLSGPGPWDPKFRLGQTSDNQWIDIPPDDAIYAYRLYGPVAPTVLDEDSFVTGATISFRVQALVVCDPEVMFDPTSVFLYPVNKFGSIAGPSICQLLDDGLGADHSALDGVFSCNATIGAQATPGSLYVRVEGDLLASSEVTSGTMVLEVVRPMTGGAGGETEAIAALLDDALTAWLANEPNYGATVTAIRNLTAVNGVDVHDAGVSNDSKTIWIEFDTGTLDDGEDLVQGGLMLNTAGELSFADSPDESGTPVSSAGPASGQPGAMARTGLRDDPPASSPASMFPGNDDVLLWAPFSTALSPVDDTVAGLLQTATCPSFNQPFDHLVDAQCTVQSVESFTRYGTNIIVSHGGLWQNRGYFLTREEATASAIKTHERDLRLGRIAAFNSEDDGKRFGILPEFFDALTGGPLNWNTTTPVAQFDRPKESHTLIYLATNWGQGNSLLSSDLSHWADTVYGFTCDTPVSFADGVASQLYTALVSSPWPDTSSAYDVVDPKISGPTTFVFAGDTENGYGPCP